MNDVILKFETTVDEANVITAALGELPAKVSMNLIQKLQTQAKPQLPAQPQAGISENAAPGPELLLEAQ